MKDSSEEDNLESRPRLRVVATPKKETPEERRKFSTFNQFIVSFLKEQYSNAKNIAEGYTKVWIGKGEEAVLKATSTELDNIRKGIDIVDEAFRRVDEIVESDDPQEIKDFKLGLLVGAFPLAKESMIELIEIRERLRREHGTSVDIVKVQQSG